MKKCDRVKGQKDKLCRNEAIEIYTVGSIQVNLCCDHVHLAEHPELLERFAKAKQRRVGSS